MTRPRLRGRAAAALGASALALVAALPAWTPARPRAGPAPAERLTYLLRFLGIEAGTLELTRATEEDPPGARFVVEMRITSTNRLLEGVFRVRESWRSTVDREGLFSHGYELARRHGATELADSETFDYERSLASWTRREAGREHSGEVAISGPVQDPVSWIYYCRERIAAGAREVLFTTVERGRARAARLAVGDDEEVDLGALGRVRALRTSGAVGFGGLGGGGGGGGGDGHGRDEGVDQAASALWFDAATGVLVKARIAAKVGAMELVLRAAEGVAAPGGGR